MFIYSSSHVKVVPGRASLRDVFKGILLKLYTPTVPSTSTVFVTSTSRGLGILTIIGLLPPDELVEGVLLVEPEEVKLPPEVLLDELVEVLLVELELVDPPPELPPHDP